MLTSGLEVTTVGAEGKRGAHHRLRAAVFLRKLKPGLCGTAGIFPSTAVLPNPWHGNGSLFPGDPAGIRESKERVSR